MQLFRFSPEAQLTLFLSFVFAFASQSITLAHATCAGAFRSKSDLAPLHHQVQERLNQYVRETGASVRKMAFPKIQGGAEMGPERTVLALSAASFASFVQHFSDLDMFSTMGHGNLLFKNSIYAYNGQRSDFRLPALNTPLPIVLLKPTEAQRFGTYMNLIVQFGGSWSSKLKQPWQIPGYMSAQGGYHCCIHWIGNIPIGDKLVEEYSLPGGDNQPPRIAKLSPYQPRDQQDQWAAQVWTYPGHEQLADTLGQKDANLRGEFASAGWVIQSLLGGTSTERVPLVFIVTNDHQAPIPDHPQLNYEQPL